MSLTQLHAGREWVKVAPIVERCRSVRSEICDQQTAVLSMHLPFEEGKTLPFTDGDDDDDDETGRLHGGGLGRTV